MGQIHAALCEKVFWHHLFEALCPPRSSEAGAISGKVSSAAKATVTVTVSLSNTGWYRLSGFHWHGVSAPLTVWIASVVGWPSAVLVWECFHVLWPRYRPHSTHPVLFQRVYTKGDKTWNLLSEASLAAKVSLLSTFRVMHLKTGCRVDPPPPSYSHSTYSPWTSLSLCWIWHQPGRSAKLAPYVSMEISDIIPLYICYDVRIQGDGLIPANCNLIMQEPQRNVLMLLRARRADNVV